MEIKQNKWILLLCIMMMLALGKPVLAYGSGMVPSTIRVGLRSAYSNQSSIEVKNEELEIGYEANDSFISEATLTSNTGFIIKASGKQYYTTREVFPTYNAAAYALLDYKIQAVPGLVVYSSPGNWYIYLEEDLGDMDLVRNTGNEVVVQNGLGIDFILCENNVLASAFAGKSSEHSFNLTQLSKGTYRGWFEFIRKGSTITAANVVDYEEYLYGVIPAEMPASWNMEALKAQAVAARSMSIYQYNKYVKDGYNVCDTTFTQVYKGFSGENPTTNQAVDETRGIVATYNGRVAETLYSSTSGGYTEDPKYVWGNEVPYLKSIPDPYETEPEMKPWIRTITLSDLDLSLGKQNVNIGKATGMRINSYTPAGRVNELEILGTSGSHKIIRENIRTFFNGTKEGSLRSRMFTMENGDTTPRTESKTETMKVSFENLQVYEGNRARYILGATGKIGPVGDSLTVEGPRRQVIYGEGTSGESTNSATSHTQYGDIIISGKGFGHGVGMSQSGARGMAKAGYTYDEIIKYYFQGVELQR